MQSSIVNVLAVIAVLLYVASVTWAAIAAFRSSTPPTLHPLVRQTLLIIGPALATYLGVKLGIEIESHSPMFSAFSLGADKGPLVIYTYLASLVASWGVWLLRPNSTPPELQTLALSLLGILAGALAVWKQ